MLAKICAKCGTEKPIDEFYKNKTTKDGFFRRCKSCVYGYQKKHIQDNRKKHNKQQRDYKRKWAKENPTKHRRQRTIQTLRSMYGITIEQYDEMFSSQNGVCAICGKPETQENRYGMRRLSVDHDHKTKGVRGLLCAKCNSVLGFVEDDVTILQSAIKYLEGE